MSKLIDFCLRLFVHQTIFTRKYSIDLADRDNAQQIAKNYLASPDEFSLSRQSMFRPNDHCCHDKHDKHDKHDHDQLT